MNSMVKPEFKLNEIVIHHCRQSIIEKAEWSYDKGCWVYCLSNDGWQEEKDLLRIK